MILYDEIMNIEDIDATEVLMLNAIINLQANGMECYASNEYFAHVAHCSEAAVKRKLADLSARNLIDLHYNPSVANYRRRTIKSKLNIEKRTVKKTYNKTTERKPQAEEAKKEAMGWDEY